MWNFLIQKKTMNLCIGTKELTFQLMSPNRIAQMFLLVRKQIMNAEFPSNTKQFIVFFVNIFLLMILTKIVIMTAQSSCEMTNHFQRQKKLFYSCPDFQSQPIFSHFELVSALSGIYKSTRLKLISFPPHVECVSPKLQCPGAQNRQQLVLDQCRFKI